MDTASHVLFGATMTGLAMTDPAIAAHPERFGFVLAAMVLSSHAPDFDTVARLKGRSAYLRWHRGVTHSIPALFLWPLLPVAASAAAFGLDGAAIHLYAWCFAAVLWHVVLDALNGYGVQCLRPFTRRWVHLDVLTLWDPFLFVVHAAALTTWAAGAVEPYPTFPVLYAITFLYIGLRGWRRRRWLQRIREAFRTEGVCYVMPCLHWWRWAFLAEREDRFVSGFVREGRIEIAGSVMKSASPESDPWIQASKAAEAVNAFLGFAARAHVDVTETEEGCEVRWTDVRFHYGGKLPFGVEVKFDRDRRIVSESIGWRKKVWEGPYV